MASWPRPAPPTRTSEKNASKISSKTGSSRLSLIKRDPQRGTQDLPVRQYSRLACAPHRVERLGDRDAHAAEAQQPHEPVQGGFHDEA